MNRFSKENIEKHVVAPKMGIMNSLRRLAGTFIDFSGVLGALFFLILAIGLNVQLFYFLAIVFALIQLILAYFLFVKFNQIKVNKYRIDLDLKKEVTFVFVSDLHVGKEFASTNKNRLNKIINQINQLKPEMVLLGGDFLAHNIEPELLKNLSNIQCKNTYAVFGNHDAEYLDDNVAYNTPIEFINAFNQSGIKMLINNHVDVVLNGVKLNIGGIPDLYSKNFNIDTTFEGSKENDLRILLSHNPDIIDFVLESDNIDLILSGHNHSGQIYFPKIGAVLPMPTKRKWLTKGLFQINKRTKLFLSQGIGHSGSRLRINTDSEVCLITLY